MFRDLKEYQSIQSIYEEKVCISDEQRIITSIFEEQEFTEEELAYVKENLEEVLNQVSIEILEEVQEGKFLSEEILTEEDEALLTEMLIGEGIGALIKKGVQKAIPLAKKAASGIKTGIQKATPVIKKGLQKTKEVAKSAIGKVKQGVKAVVNNPTVKKVGTALLKTAPIGAAAVGIKKGIDFLRNRNKKETPTTGGEGGQTQTQTTDTVQGNQGSGKEIPKAKPLSDPNSARGKLQQQNIERFGKDKVQQLRDKNAAFQASKRKDSGYTRADFIKDFPNSNAAKEARAKKGRPNIMDYETYNPLNSTQKTMFNNSYDHKSAVGLAEAYKNMYDPNYQQPEVLDEETTTLIADYLLSEGILDSIEEVNQFMEEASPEDLQEIFKKIKQAAASVGDKVKQGVDKVKDTAGKVKTAVGNEINKRKEQISDYKSGGKDKLIAGNKLRKDTKKSEKDVVKKTEMNRKGDVTAQSGMGNDPGRERARLLFLKNKRKKMNEATDKDAYTKVLEYLLTQNHVDTIEEANYVMTELDAETIQDIVEMDDDLTSSRSGDLNKMYHNKKHKEFMDKVKKDTK